MLTMNYEFLQNKYGKSKKKGKRLVDEKYKLTKGCFTASEWKDYKDWIKEQKKKDAVQQKEKKQPKKQKGKKKQSSTTKKNNKPKADKKPSYSELLQHPMWKKKRNEVLLQKGHKCQICGANHGTLHVHHTYYSMDKMPWEYPNSSLVVLCKDCHKKVHSDKKHKLYPVFL